MSDGQELLALFVDKDDLRWVAWTPSGYYMASPGGEDLIGWHVNRGWDQAADFFPASRFRERFSRPDIVGLVLDTLDEDAAIKKANQIAGRKLDTRPLVAHLPPIIRITGPAGGTHVSNGMTTLDYAVRSPSGQPIESIYLLLNGRPVKAVGLPIRTVAADTEIRGAIEVTLTQHITEVGLIAWTGGLASEVARIKVTWDGAPEAIRRLFALVIGVSDYSDPAMKLTYAAKDARDFDKALKSQRGAYYVDVETRVLTDREVTRSSIIDGLAWLKTVATNPNDVSVVFLAGHGLTDEKQTYWFFPSDATGGDDVHAKGVSRDEVRQSLTKLSGRVLWFLDTCHAGSAGKRPPVDINVLVNTVTSAENGGIVVFASSTGRQLSAESSDWGNGAFTKAIVEGIQLGKADLLGDGFITTSSLDTFVEHRVRVLTEDRQNPVMGRPPDEPDFAIAQVSKR
jgi:Caspase domain